MGIYGRWMDRWERKLATRDTNRVVRPFEWGTDWLNAIGYPSIPAEVNGDGRDRLSPVRGASAGGIGPLLHLRAGARLPVAGIAG